METFIKLDNSLNAIFEQYNFESIAFTEIKTITLKKSLAIQEALYYQHIDKPIAMVLFSFAGNIENHLQQHTNQQPNTPSINDRLISYLNCMINCGNFIDAQKNIAVINKETLTTRQKSNLNMLELKINNLAQEKHLYPEVMAYFMEKDASKFFKILPNLWGTIPIQAILWATYRILQFHGQHHLSYTCLRALAFCNPFDLNKQFLHWSTESLDKETSLNYAISIHDRFKSTESLVILMSSLYNSSQNISKYTLEFEKHIDKYNTKTPKSFIEWGAIITSNHHQQAGNLKESISILNQCLHIVPESEFIAASLASYTLEQKEWIATVKLLTQTIGLAENHFKTHWIYSYLGYAYLQLDEHELAETTLIKARDASVDSSTPYTINLNNLAIACMHQGKTTQAVQLLWEAIALTEDPIILDNFKKITKSQSSYLEPIFDAKTAREELSTPHYLLNDMLLNENNHFSSNIYETGQMPV